jgi:hypothetical protein
MNISIKVFGLSLSLISASTMLFASSEDHNYTVEFSFQHVPAKNFSQPAAGTVLAQVNVFQKGFLGLTAHRARTPGNGLILNAKATDSTQRGPFAADPFGWYEVDVHCKGVGEFLGQETSRHLLFLVPSPTSVLIFLKRASITVGCPMNQAATSLVTPEVESKVLPD